MHSRIYQIATEPVKKEEYLSENDFSDHWFTNSIADYVSDETDRDEEIKTLKDSLETRNIARFDADSSFIFIRGGKEAYFRPAYKAFVEARKKSHELFLSEFANNGELFSQLMYTMKSAYCDKFSWYVSSDEFETIPFDEFVRGSEIGRRYYIGAVLDYHF